MFKTAEFEVDWRCWTFGASWDEERFCLCFGPVLVGWFRRTPAGVMAWTRWDLFKKMQQLDGGQG